MIGVKNLTIHNFILFVLTMGCNFLFLVSIPFLKMDTLNEWYVHLMILLVHSLLIIPSHCLTGRMLFIWPFILINSCIKTLHLSTPTNILYGRFPTYDHLKIFGCLYFLNLSSTAQHKLSPRSIPCVFLRFSQNFRGYSYLDLTLKKIIISLHVHAMR